MVEVNHPAGRVSSVQCKNETNLAPLGHHHHLHLSFHVPNDRLKSLSDSCVGSLYVAFLSAFVCTSFYQIVDGSTVAALLFLIGGKAKTGPLIPISRLSRQSPNIHNFSFVLRVCSRAEETFIHPQLPTPTFSPFSHTSGSATG